MKKSWNHRVIETQQDGQSILTIHEVHYTAAGEPLDHADPTIVDGTSIGAIRELLASMHAALVLPILQAEVFGAPAAPAAIIALPVRDLMPA